MGQYFTDFSEYSAGSGLPTDWTARWVTTGIDWSVENVGGAIGGKVLQALVSGSFARRAASWNTPGIAGTVQILVKSRRNSTLVNGSIYSGSIARGAGSASSESGYVGSSYVGSSTSNNRLKYLAKYVSGSGTAVGATDASITTSGDWYWYRFECTGTTVRLRVWKDGDSEPGSWDVSTTDSDLSSGWVGVFAGIETTGNAIVQWDTFGVGTNGDPAPSTPPNTAPTITVGPSVSYGNLTRLGPSNSPAIVSFTATDPEETGAGDLDYEIRTATGGGGTLVASGSCTSGVAENVNLAHNASGLSGNGSQALYLVVGDGTDDTEESFTLLQDNAAPTVGTIIHSPNPVVP